MNSTHRNIKILTASAVAVVLLLLCRTAPAAESDKILFDFSGEEPGAGWRAVNDNVMGGVSKGGPRFPGNGSMVFAGSLSLKNRGGFSSIRTSRKRMDLSGYDGLAVRVRGDGRTYSLTVSTNARIPAGSYRVLVPTKAGEWQTIRAPFASFKATSFGRVLPVFPRLNRAKVESIGFLIADKKAGPFRMEVDWIKAVPKAPAKDPAPPAAADNIPSGDIVDTAVAAGSFKTLVAAVQAAGLVETLKSEGPLTVFAPTDEAFAKLPEGTVERLLKPENREQLTAVLTYHVVPGRIVLGKQSLASVEGSALDVNAAEGLTVNGATITTANIEASNGVIHVIDQVLLPDLPEPTPARKAESIIELAIKRGVPLFNSGRIEASAAIYEVTAQSLLTGHADALDETARKRLGKALADVQKDHSPRKKAWALRYALDDVRRSLRKSGSR